jgi:hypothetical protein
VLIATKSAQILSVAPDQIRVQVPFDVPVGLVNVVVQRGEVRSRPVSVRVMANAVAARTKNDLGFGEAGVIDGNRLSVSMTGFGSAEPKGVRAYVGGLPAEAKAVLSEARAGEVDVAIDLPEGSLLGDIVSVSNGGVPATRFTLGAASDAVVQYVRLPAPSAMSVPSGNPTCAAATPPRTVPVPSTAASRPGYSTSPAPRPRASSRVSSPRLTRRRR